MIYRVRMSEHAILEWHSDGDGAVVRDGDRVFSQYWGGNLLGGDAEPDWSEGVWAWAPGWLPADEGEPVSPADPGVSFRTFAAAGRSALDAALARVRTAAAGGRVLLRPTATSALSDIPSVRSVANGWGAADPFGLLLDPAALLTPGMLDKADDHLVRMAEELVPLPAVRAVLVTDLTADGSAAAVGSVGAGALPLDSLRTVAAAARAARAPVVLRADGAVGAQLERLGLA